MANQDNKNFVNNMVDAQKQAVDTVLEQTRKFTNGNSVVNETLQKNSEWYKNWLDSQRNVFSNATEKTTEMTGNMQNNINRMNEFYQNWFQTQMNWARQMWEMNNSFFQKASGNDYMSQMNPANMFQNMQQNWNNWMSGINNTQSWMKMMQQWNSLFNMEEANKMAENWNSIFQQYQDMLKANWSKLQENMQSGTAFDAYKSMTNATESFAKFYEMWMPMWKSIQEKTFNMEMYKQWMNPSAYKELMDQYLGFLPESSRQYMQQMSAMMQDGSKQFQNMSADGYRQMRQFFENTLPGANPQQFFGSMLSGYNQFYSMMNDAAAPFTRMMTPNQHTKTMMEWQDIANRIAVYNIKNAELQYMMYMQGTKVMDKLAENVAAKIQNGEEITSMLQLFQEWMNLSDQTYVSLFESDEYSQLMAEVSAMQLKLKKDIEVQMEHFMVGIPVATRSEMDELYKTIYDLKKQVRQMEKMMELTETSETETEDATPKATRKTTVSKK